MIFNYLKVRYTETSLKRDEAKKMKKQAIIFDVDGLLVDTEKYYTKTWQQALAKYGYDISDDEVKTFSGYNWRMIRERLAQKYDMELAQKVVEERERLLQMHIEAGHIQAKPYAKETLTWAKDHGLRLAIASSGKKARAQKIVTLLGLMPFFESCVFGDDVEKNKPNPDPYLKALDNMKLANEKDKVVAVEDSLVGATAATKAGLEVIVIPDASVHPDNYTAKELADINVYAEGHDLRVVQSALSQA